MISQGLVALLQRRSVAIVPTLMSFANVCAPLNLSALPLYMLSVGSCAGVGLHQRRQGFFLKQEIGEF